MFEFKKIDRIEGQAIDLQLDETVPANDAKGYVPAYKFNIMLHNTDVLVGVIDLRIGYNEQLYYGGHIGYTVLEPYRGNSYATKACQLIKEVALAHEMERLYITCNPDNHPSRRTCEKVGLDFKGIVKLPLHNDMVKRGETHKCLYEWNLS